MIEALSAFETQFNTKVGVESARFQSLQSQAATPGAVSQDFDTLLAQLAGDMVGAMKKSEAVSIAGIQGKASAQQVVEAVLSAEQALQMAIAVRDKVVQAYQEIGRMAI